ncbi:hypothetical protein [Solirubrobacter pauli]|uniref:hypothetical protein n=1 Tax=Solirubrobacter pauli TaxID=166793 RepID=UPI0011C44C45|nr:hypothetical protein [Solirubrobacter pauli]
MFAIHDLPWPETARAQYNNCGFDRDRRIEFRRHISCAEAERVLRQLKGARDTVPMVCGRPRVLQGWRLSNPERDFGVVWTDYRHGKVSFTYQRADHVGHRAWCPPEAEELGQEGV